MKAKPFISIVIPVYNEAKNITLLTEELVSILPKLKKHGRSFLLMTVQPMKAFRPLRRFQTNGPAFVFLVLKKTAGRQRHLLPDSAGQGAKLSLPWMEICRMTLGTFPNFLKKSGSMTWFAAGEKSAMIT